MGQAKWWGWGDEAVAFTHADKPGLAPFLERALGLDVRGATSRPAGFDDLDIPESTLSPALRSELEAATGSAHVSTDALDRVVHARGKSLRDLVRHRRGDVGRLPDVVVRPADEDETSSTAIASSATSMAAERTVRPPQDLDDASLLTYMTVPSC